MRDIILQLHITGRCNLRCRHCYIDDHASELSFIQIKEIVKQFDDLLSKLRAQSDERIRAHIHLTGGEPFLHTEIRKILRYFVHIRHKYYYGIMANGTVISHYDLLTRLRLKVFQVSVDGDEKTHNYIRGENNFQRVLAGVDELNKRGIRVRVSFTANRDNYRQFPYVAQVCREHGVHSLWSDRYIPTREGGIFPICAEDMLSYARILRAEKDNPQNACTGLLIQNNRALQFIGGGETPYRCAAGERLIVVDEHGDIYPCRRLPIVCGNIINQTLSDVYYNNEVFLELRKHNISGKCLACLYKTSCGGGLRCLSYCALGQFDVPDPSCIM